MISNFSHILRNLALLFGLMLCAAPAWCDTLVLRARSGTEGLELFWPQPRIDSKSEAFVELQGARITEASGLQDAWQALGRVDVRQGYAQIDSLEGPRRMAVRARLVYLRTDNLSGRVTESIGQWMPAIEVRIPRPWDTVRFLTVLGALAMFIFGMREMSAGVQNAAGSRLKKLLNYMAQNRFAGLLSGLTITGVIQSSSAITVMVVSFVNAGLLTLKQSVGIIMGANIGTTVTGWLVSFLGFRFNLNEYALVVLAVGVPMLFVRSGAWRASGQALSGFALLILGLTLLKDSVPAVDEGSMLVQTLLQYSAIPVLGLVIFLLLGIVSTVVVQSSSASMALTLTLCATGVLSIESSAAMILGANIGTTATAEIAALVGNVHAKRSARVHTLFNIIGTAWMIFLIPLVLPLIATFMEWLGTPNPMEDSEAGRQAATTALAAFHTLFNVLNAALLIWFVPQLVKLATRTVRSKGVEDEEFRLEFIDAPVNTSEFALVEAQQHVVKYAEITARMSGFIQRLLLETGEEERQQLIKRVRKYEEITDRLEVEISLYLRKTSTTELSDEASERVRSLLSIVGDLERIGDIFYQMSRSMKRKDENRVWFVPEQRSNLQAMFKRVDEAFVHMVRNLRVGQPEEVDLRKARELEQAINKLRNSLRTDYFDKLESGEFQLRSGIIYNDLFASLEKVGDHIYNVSEALSGKI